MEVRAESAVLQGKILTRLMKTIERNIPESELPPNMEDSSTGSGEEPSKNAQPDCTREPGTQATGEYEDGHAEDCDASNGVHTDKDQNFNLSRPPSPLPKDTEIRVHELANACEPMKDPPKGETSLMLISSDTILPAVQCGGEAGVNSGESPTILYTSHIYIYIYLSIFVLVLRQLNS